MVSDSNQTIQHTIISTNGIRLHVAQAGSKSASLLILLHGFPEFWYGWQKQIPALAAAGFRVWAPDQRGYNLSDKPESIAEYNLDQLAADIVGLIDAAKADKIYLVGHDWGAVVAWWTAINYPERLHKLVILNVPHLSVMKSYVRTHFVQMVKSWYILFFQLPWLPEFMLKFNNHRFLAASIKMTSQASTFSNVELALYKKAWSQPNAIKSMLNWYRALLRYSPTSTASDQVTTPTLIIWGRHDAFLSYEMAELSVQKCENGRLVIIPNATHWVQHEAADQVNQLILDFLKGDHDEDNKCEKKAN